jgi:uncharacterized protein YukE
MAGRIARSGLVGRLLALALLPALAAAAPTSDPDWPCRQVLVPQLTAGTLWSGPPLGDLGDWRVDAAVAALVQHIAPGDVSTEAGEAAIADFLRGLGPDRDRSIGLAFSGLLDETNRARGEAIERIKDLAERQRNIAQLVAKLTAELDAMPAEPQGDAAAARAELQQRWTFTSRTYNEVERTMRYACEVPVALDARLGAYARALEAARH